MAVTNEPLDGFIQSHEPANNGYGQNGYLGQSSDLPGQRTTSGFLPELDPLLVTGYKKSADWQTRTVSDVLLPGAHGMKRRMGDGVIPPNGRPVKR